jgi:serine/threonine protein kinase
MELVEGGELLDRIVSKSVYNEKEARDVCTILFDTIAYMHEQNVAHRDLKLENLLLMSSDNDMDIKIADFGFAKIAKTDYSLRTGCGTPCYVAPEIIRRQNYGTKVDMWSMGVIVYLLLSGTLPFYSENMQDMFGLIKKGDYTFHEEQWGNISDDAKDLVSQLLTVDPKKRISASEALNSNWIRSEELESHDLGSNLQELKKFNAKRKLKQAVMVVMANNKMTRMLERLRLCDSESDDVD